MEQGRRVGPAEADLGEFLPGAWSWCPTAPVIADTDFARGFFEPAWKDTFDARIGVVFQPFCWDDGEPWIWLLCTVGLASITQVAKPAPIGKKVAPVSPHFELCAAVLEPPSPPMWEEFRRAWEEDELDTCEALPTIIPRFAEIAHDFASWIVRDGDAFAIGDHVQHACLAPEFPSALLVPPIPELFVSGLRPFDAEAVVSELPIGRWPERDALHAAGDHLFIQLAPLRAEEYDVARWDGYRFFLNALLATNDEIERGVNTGAHIVDLERASRHSFA
jgi:hypothetical protein